MAVKITRWDASDYLETWEDIAPNAQQTQPQ